VLGILADDMGLGKTLEIIALILTNFEGGKPLAVPVAGKIRPSRVSLRNTFCSTFGEALLKLKFNAIYQIRYWGTLQYYKLQPVTQLDNMVKSTMTETRSAVLRLRRNCSSDGAERTDAGRAFHALAAVTGKAVTGKLTGETS